MGRTTLLTSHALGSLTKSLDGSSSVCHLINQTEKFHGGQCYLEAN